MRKDFIVLVHELLEEFPTMTYFEACKVAVELQRNDIVKDAFGVTDSGKTPAFLEGVAIALGYK